MHLTRLWTANQWKEVSSSSRRSICIKVNCKLEHDDELVFPWSKLKQNIQIKEREEESEKDKPL